MGKERDSERDQAPKKETTPPVCVCASAVTRPIVELGRRLCVVETSHKTFIALYAAIIMKIACLETIPYHQPFFFFFV